MFPPFTPFCLLLAELHSPFSTGFSHKALRGPTVLLVLSKGLLEERSQCCLGVLFWGGGFYLGVYSSASLIANVPLNARKKKQPTSLPIDTHLHILSRTRKLV